MKWAIGLVCAAALLASTPIDVGAQMRGLGRIAGKVTDEAGAPLGGVSIRAKLAGYSGEIESTSDDSGAWAVSGLARGEWDVSFEKPGYVPRRAKVTLPVELARVPPVNIALRKAS